MAGNFYFIKIIIPYIYVKHLPSHDPPRNYTLRKILSKPSQLVSSFPSWHEFEWNKKMPPIILRVKMGLAKKPTTTHQDIKSYYYNLYFVWFPKSN